MESLRISTPSEPPTPSSIDSPRSSRSLRRDDEFYCQDVIFLVDEVLFKVPRQPFERESLAFKATFGLPSPSDPSAEEGLSDDRPIHLEGVLEEEFRALLRVMLRPSYGPSITMTKDQWISVLKLSSMWDFDSFREKAIKELARIVREPVARIVLARNFHIPSWMEPALHALAQQETLSAAELEALGWSTAAKLMQVRESMAVGTNQCMCACNYCTVAHGPVANGPVASPGARHCAVSMTVLRKSYDFTQTIRELFGTELY